MENKYIDLINVGNEEAILDRKISKDGAYKHLSIKDLGEDGKLSATNDYVFKMLVLNSKNKEVLCKLLSYRLNVSYEYLLDNLYIGNSELDIDKYGKKNEKVDCIAWVNGVAINIEVNCSNNANQLKRNIEYTDRIYSKKVKIGDKVFNATRIIQINYCNFTMDKVDKEITYGLLMNEDGILLSRDKEYCYVFIPNIRKKSYNGCKLNEEERLILSIMEDSKSKAHKFGEGIEIVEKYFKIEENALNDNDFVNFYETREIDLESRYLDGKEDKQKEIIKNMLDEGLELEIISKYLKMSVEEIEELLK